MCVSIANSMSSEGQGHVHYVCLYTHQKRKKRKVWQDGFVRVDSSRKLLLYDDARKVVIDSMQLPESDGAVPSLEGLETESEKFLIMLENVDAAKSSWPGLLEDESRIAASRAGSHSSANSSFESQRSVPRRRTGLRGALSFKPPKLVYETRAQPQLPPHLPQSMHQTAGLAREKSQLSHYTPPSLPSAILAQPLQLWSIPQLQFLSLSEGPAALSPSLDLSAAAGHAHHHVAPVQQHRHVSAQTADGAAQLAHKKPASVGPQSSPQHTAVPPRGGAHQQPEAPAHSGGGAAGAPYSMSSTLLWPSWLTDCSTSRGLKRGRGGAQRSIWAPLGYPPPLELSGRAPPQAAHTALHAAALVGMQSPDAECAWRPLPFPLGSATCSPPHAVRLSSDGKAAFLLWLAGYCIRQCNTCLYDTGNRYSSAGGVHVTQSAARRAGVALYARLKLLKIPPKKGGPADEASAAATASPRYFLVLDGASDKEHSSKYSLGDLWVISTSRHFNGGTAESLAPLPAKASGGGRGGAKGGKGGWFGGGAQNSNQKFVFFARAAYHGISSKSMLQVLPLSGDACFAPPSLGSGAVEAAVCAVRIPMDGSELETLACASEALRDLIGSVTAPSARLVPALAEPPLHPFQDAANLIHPAEAPVQGSMTDLNTSHRLAQNTFSNFNTQFNLNEQQSAVLGACLRFVQAGSDATPPPCIQLVRGIFGAGKSHTLVASICACLALSQALQAMGRAPPLRILVLAGTNVAVDRILLGLLEAGCESFARVGSLRAIAPPLLPFLLQGGGSAEGLASSRQEMHSILTAHAAATSSGDTAQSAAALRRALARLGRKETQAELREAPVVGCTLASAHSEAMQGLAFDLVILDEASQVTVPAAMGPLLRSGARGALLVGDPAQLPPPVSSSGKPKGGVASDPLECAGLFDVMQAAGTREIPLSVQYRCHPAIADVASRLFYSGSVKSGITAEQRPAVLSGASPLVFLDTSDSSTARAERSGGGGSLRNAAEVAAVVRAVEELLATGTMQPKDIGVICTYRAQVAAIQGALAGLAAAARQAASKVAAAGGGGDDAAVAGLAWVAEAEAVQVATVDAFQGNEREVVIVSTVHCGPAADASRFIDDARRVNVALTRARRAFVLVGHGPTLRACKHWGGVVAASTGRAVGGVLSRLPPLPGAAAARVRLAAAARAPMCVLSLCSPGISHAAGGAPDADSGGYGAGSPKSLTRREEPADSEQNEVWDALTQ